MSDYTHGELLVAEEAITEVLARAHRTAQAEDEPNEARAVLHIARTFADELAETDPEFDRVGFIEASMDRS